MEWDQRLQEDDKALDETRCRKKITTGGGKRTTDNGKRRVADEEEALQEMNINELQFLQHPHLGNIYDFSAFEIWCLPFA